MKLTKPQLEVLREAAEKRGFSPWRSTWRTAHKLCDSGLLSWSWYDRVCYITDAGRDALNTNLGTPNA